MAKNTPDSLKNQVMYSVYVRNHTPEGTFAALEKDLPRIKGLGVDVLWFLPIHPPGMENKKGALGCPYSIQDYRAVNPEYGTLEDFKRLTDAIHAQGMTCMIDVVYNHTSWDSVLKQEHPEWFYRGANGGFGNRAGAWDDVIDLDYANPDLWDYQIETLVYWAKAGVDGFRCDVASVVPVDFWVKARAAVEKAKPGVVWLAESVHQDFVRTLRENGFYCASDAELYEAFDVTYEYDIRGLLDGYFDGSNSLQDYLQAMQAQESVFPQNYVKLRCLENHDQPRIAALLNDAGKLATWTAFSFFSKGMAFIYGGQEVMAKNVPSLFDIDKVEWNSPVGGEDAGHTALLKKLAKMKKDAIFATGHYRLAATGKNGSVALARYWDDAGRTLIGVFDLEGAGGQVPVPLEDGAYENQLTGRSMRVRNGMLPLDGAIVLDVSR